MAALPAGAASAKKKHRSCPKGQVHTRQGCRTRLPGATYRSADQRVAVRLTPGAYSETTPIDEVQFGASEVYPYQHPCTGPGEGVAPTSETYQAGSVEAAYVYFKTKTAYVGTTFSGQQGVTGDAENVDGGQRTIGVNTTTRGKVLSAKTVAGTVTVTETRAFNGKVYSTCGSTFSFTVHRYVGAYPPHNSQPPATTP